MKRWRWIRLDVLYAVHDRLIAEHGGLDGVRDAEALESAMARPQQKAVYGKPDAADLAAAYAYALARTHGFADGNKRTAWAVARLFLAEQGYTLRPNPIEAIRQMEGLAANTVAEEQLAAWFREHLQRVPSRRSR